MNERVLTYVDRAVDQTAAAVLDDQALGLSGGNKPSATNKPSGVTLVIVAGGFQLYATKADEQADLDNNKWHPGTTDFKAAGGKNPREASTPDDLFTALLSGQAHIGRVVIIGHGGTGLRLGLKGHLNDLGLLDFDTSIDADTLDANQDKIRQIAARLDPNATIDFVACGTSLNQTFLKKAANSFGQCARGFSGTVFWEYPIDDKTKKINEANRGRTSINNQDFKKGYMHLVPDSVFCPDPAPQPVP